MVSWSGAGKAGSTVLENPARTNEKEVQAMKAQAEEFAARDALVRVACVSFRLSVLKPQEPRAI